MTWTPSARVACKSGRLVRSNLLCAHQHHFWLVRSKTKTPTTKEDWTEPEALGFRRRYDRGLTYVALVIDGDDTWRIALTKDFVSGIAR